MADETTKWKVESLDSVLIEDRWMVNDSHEVGQVLLTNVGVATDGDLFDQLVDAGYLCARELPEGIMADGGFDVLYIDNAFNGKPVFNLIREEV